MAESFKATILHVDGNERRRQQISNTLLQAGSKVMEAATSAEALRLALEQPDLILLTVNPSDPSDGEVCRRLKADSRTAAIPVLQLSPGPVNGRSKAIDWEGGADGYLAHPVEPCLLLSNIKALLRLRAAEEALRASEAKFRSLAEESLAGVAIIQDGQFKYVNQAVASIVGYSRDEMLSTGSALEIVAEEDLPLVRDIRRRWLEEGEQGIRFSFRARKRDGSLATLDVLGSCFAFEGRPAVMSTVLDITGGKQAEAKLGEQAERLHLAMQAARMGWWIWDIDAHRTTYSDELGRLFGLPAGGGSASRDVFLAAIHKADRERFDAIVARVLEHDTPYEAEYRVVSPDGGVHWLASRGQLYRDPSGKPLRVVGVAMDITERKKAEESLQASEERFRHILQTAADAIVVVDQQGCICLINEQAKAKFGYQEDELLGLPVEQLLPEHLRQKHADYVRNYLAAPRMRTMGESKDLLARRKDGSEFPCEISLSPMRHSEGLLVTAVIRDISDRKTHEKLLQDIAQAVSSSTGELFFQALTEYLAKSVDADHAFIGRLLASEGTVQAVAAFSGAASAPSFTYKLEGTPCEQVIKDRQMCIFPAGVRQTFPRDHLVVEMGVEAYVGIPLVSAADNVLGLMVVLFGKPLQDAERIVALLRIFAARAAGELERVAYEESLRKAEADYRSIFENAVEGIFRTTPEGRFLAVNPTLAHMAGYSSPQEMMTLIRDIAGQLFATPKRREEFKAELEARGTVHGYECEYRRKDGSTVWVSVNARTVRDATGKALYYEGFAKDISRSKSLEDQLRQAQKMEAIGQLAGGVAHDFNNLLTVITGCSEIVLGSLSADDPNEMLLAEVVKAGNRAADLTRQLLAFGRKQMLAPRVLDLNDVVEHSEKMLRRLIGEDVFLIVALDPTLNRIRFDPSQLEQVIINLAVNARDAMPQGGRLTIRTRNESLDPDQCLRYPGCKPGSYVALTMTDTGFGMTPAVMARIFEPFFTTKEVGKGTGLGLATVYGIVKQSDGYISVESTVDVGTTFTVFLPSVDASATALLDDPTEAPERGSETVLLVEDEDGVRNLARQVLEMYGYRVIEASNGPQAISMAEAHIGQLDLLLTDVVMPHMSGRQVVEAIVPRHEGLRVLYMSGHNDDAMVRHGVATEVDAFLQKPFSPTALARKVREVLGKGTFGA